MVGNIDAIVRECRKCAKRRIDRNQRALENSQDPHLPDMTGEKLFHLVRNYGAQLRSLRNAHASGNKAGIARARTRILQSFSGKLLATARASDNDKTYLPFSTLEERAHQLCLDKASFETVIVRPVTSAGKLRLVASSGRRRRAQQLLIRDMLSATIGDSPCDGTVAGAGGERNLFQDFDNAISEGYPYWVSIDICNFFQSLKPGHLAGFPLSQWIIENIVFLPPSVPIVFIDQKHGVKLSEAAIMKGDDDDLPKAYPHSMSDIRSMLKMVRRGLITGDVCAPQIARTVLGRELQRVLGKWDVAYASHLDDILLGARSLAELKASTQALSQRLQCHPAGPLELHDYDIRHVRDGLSFLGYQVSLKSGGELYVRPGPKRFDRFRERLFVKFQNSLAYERQELLEIGMGYAHPWFVAQPAWKKSAQSWSYVVAEVNDVINHFIEIEMGAGIGKWSESDLG